MANFNGWVLHTATNSVIKNNYTIIHYKDGLPHNINAPAYFRSIGPYYYYQNGNIYRENGPAGRFGDECFYHYKNGDIAD